MHKWPFNFSYYAEYIQYIFICEIMSDLEPFRRPSNGKQWFL